MMLGRTISHSTESISLSSEAPTCGMSVNDTLEASMGGDLWAVDVGSDIAVRLGFNGTDWQPAFTLVRPAEAFRR